MSQLSIHNAYENNLQHIDLVLPRNKLIVVTGVSGSGKSSLVFDTIFAAAQAELLESMSSFARRSMPRFEPPKVGWIEGLSPTFAIDQSMMGRNPRSTVGTVTDIYAFLRLLFSRVGTPALTAGDFSFNTPKGACETCHGLGTSLQPDLSRLLDERLSLNQGAIQHRTWKVGGRYWNIIAVSGFFDMDKPISSFTAKERETLLYHPPVNLQDKTLGVVQSFSYEGIVSRLMKRATDSRGGKDYDASFFEEVICPACGGSRLNARARNVKVAGRSIIDFLGTEIRYLIPLLKKIDGDIAQDIIAPTIRRLEPLEKVGLGYLSLSRSVATLSGGEAQRVKLARQLGSSFREIIYILDEPSAGLHPADIAHLTKLLRELAGQPNTVIVVEHDLEIMRAADVVVDVGPGAGNHGGKILSVGTPQEIAETQSPTGLHLAGKAFHSKFKRRRQGAGTIRLEGVSIHNLQQIDAAFRKNAFNCVTGVSGAGKSSLIEALLRGYPDCVIFDQSPIGGSSRSIVATYVGAFDDIRATFAHATGQVSSLFAFNRAGACPACEGLGRIVFDMHFLGDVEQVCETCHGLRYNEEALRHHYRGRTIADVLDMTIEEAAAFFEKESIKTCLNLLCEVGVGYLRCGQDLTRLSGGERQRIKIAQRLTQKGQVYILDEPTRGLHPADVTQLISVLNRLVDAGNTVITVEHDLDVIKSADWIIDLGPGGGKEGGRIVGQGTPEELITVKDSVTGRYLKTVL